MTTSLLTFADAHQWLCHLDYPQPRPGCPVLVYLEGSVPAFEDAKNGTLWPSAGGAVWEGMELHEGASKEAADAIPVQAVENRPDEFNDVGVFLWGEQRGPQRIGVFLGSVNPGTVLSGRAGWPQLGDGAHLYQRSKRNDNGRPCFRSFRNRCLREQPTATAGGDLVVTLSEVAARGMSANPSILLHPGRRATWSAGCPLTPGGYDDVAWKMVWGHTRPAQHGGLWIIRHKAADVLAWIAAGKPADAVPLLRPGSNSGRWVAPMQRALGVAVDGYFGPETARVLYATRLRSGMDRRLADIPEVGAEEWHALGARLAA